MVTVVGVAEEVGSREIYCEAVAENDVYLRTEHQQLGIALVALSIEIERISGGKVLVFITLPGKDAVVVGIEREGAETTEHYECVCLGAIATAEVLVAVDDIVIVALRTAQEDGTEEDTLLKIGETAYLRELEYYSRTKGGRL